MASVSELRKKIKGIKSTRQITNAMKMIAGARLGRAQKRMVESGIFPGEFDSVLYTFINNTEFDNKKYASVLGVKNSTEKKRLGVVVISADKGLCGDFNSSAIRGARHFIAEHEQSIQRLFVVGVKANDAFSQYSFKMDHYTKIFNTLDFHHADQIGQDVLNAFFEDKLTDVYILYNNYESAMKYTFTKYHVLPLDMDSISNAAKKMTMIEPVDSEYIFDHILSLWLKSKIYSILRRQYTAELSARMRAMDNATRNAGTLIEDLTLEMNKARQSIITREIAEITGTSEVMKE